VIDHAYVRWGRARNNFKSAPCSAGRSFPAERERVAGRLATFTWPLNLLSEMAASIRPLYSAALGLSGFSAFLGANFFSDDFPAGLGSAGFWLRSSSRRRIRRLPGGLGPQPALARRVVGNSFSDAAGAAVGKLPAFLLFVMKFACGPRKTGLDPVRLRNNDALEAAKPRKKRPRGHFFFFGGFRGRVAITPVRRTNGVWPGADAPRVQ